MLSLGYRPVQCRTDRLCDLVCSTKTCQYAIDGRLQDGSAELDREGGFEYTNQLVLRYQNNATTTASSSILLISNLIHQAAKAPKYI